MRVSGQDSVSSGTGLHRRGRRMGIGRGPAIATETTVVGSLFVRGYRISKRSRSCNTVPVCIALRLTFLLILLVVFPAQAQDSPAPRGMYCGGNQIVGNANRIRAREISGTVFDSTGYVLPNAHIQLQVQGKDPHLVDAMANERGDFCLRGLPPGLYWLGIAAPGFNLHIWEVRVVRFGS